MKSLSSLITDEAKALLTEALRSVRADFTGDDVAGFLDATVNDILTRRLGELGNSAKFTERYRVNVAPTTGVPVPGA